METVRRDGGTLIAAENLVVSYGSYTALAGVSLSVRNGEFLSMLGPSGCGKTTLLRSIAGFVQPDSGDLWIGGKRMNDVPPYRRPVNMVFQGFALFPHMTVAENVAFGPKRLGVPKGEIAQRVKEALALVDLQDLGARYPRALSGGQQQRVALARAIVNRPQVLLLDEPLGALDLKLRKRMQVELKRLHSQLGLTFVYVTHDQEEALVMSDRIVVMDKGKIVQTGTGTEIYSDPASRYVADFIGEANLINCAAASDNTVTLAPSGARLPYRASMTGPVTLMVRPEDIGVGTPESEAVVLSGRVKDKNYIGQGWRIFVVLENGQEVAVQLGSRHEGATLAPGAATNIWWPAARGKILTQ